MMGNFLQRARVLSLILLCGTSAETLAAQPPPAGDFVSFESGQVRPLALSPNGKQLFAVNTPDNRLHIHDLVDGVPQLRSTVRVGLEPVAVAARSNRQVWVVNHLSDSISIVDVKASPPRVIRTLLVGDEPRDIVFAGTRRSRAFITTAHRGQNTGIDPQPFTAGIGRADIWVFDTKKLGGGIGGKPLTVLSLFGDTPRPLAVTRDGSRVYAGVFNSGNRSTVLQANISGGGLDKPGPTTDAAGNTQPRTGQIVRYKGGKWIDNGDPDNGEPPRDWSDRVRFNLPDYDVFEIDALATPPVELRRFSGVGTTLFNMVLNPDNGNLYVSNTDARNHVRFEGPGEASTTVRGHFVRSNVSVITPAGEVSVNHLNRHIRSYDDALGTEEENALSLATPTGLAVDASRGRVYIAAFGSGKIAWLPTAALDQGKQVQKAERQIELRGGGPSGLVLDKTSEYLYVLTRFNNGISTIDVAANAEVHTLRMFNPEPEPVKQGRKFLYDARLTSSRGDSSCAGCHIFGDMDHLSWDLGNPDELRVSSPNTYNSVVPGFLTVPFFHPMKGPMSTQSLRGLRGQGPMHWRGDRTGVDRNANETLEEQAFEDFNVAFTGLLGRAEMLNNYQMDLFAKFALQLSYPPNPYRALDNSLSAEEQAGSDFYHNVVSDTIATCNGCHVLDPSRGFFGGDGTMSIEGGSIDEDFKIPHMRNTYQKVGMFGLNGSTNSAIPHRGDQIRGFGFAHDGAVDTLTSFLSAGVFAFPNSTVRLNTARFVLAFPSDLAPIVGQQVTVYAVNSVNPGVRNRTRLLRDRALLQTPGPECELVVSGAIDGTDYSAVLNNEGGFSSADPQAAPLAFDALYELASVPGNFLTYTCVPPGNGTRIGIDQDLDGVLDGA